MFRVYYFVVCYKNALSVATVVTVTVMRLPYLQVWQRSENMIFLLSRHKILVFTPLLCRQYQFGRSENFYNLANTIWWSCFCTMFCRGLMCHFNFVCRWLVSWIYISCRRGRNLYWGSVASSHFCSSMYPANIIFI